MAGNTSLDNIYKSMIQRCFNESSTGYHRYGGRGITVCNEWLGDNGFRTFCNDMGSRPSAKHTLDRKNNNLGYSKENCQWSTKRGQARNRSNNFVVEAFGRKQPVCQWAEEFKIDESTLRRRLYASMDPEDALTKPVEGARYVIQVEKLPIMKEVIQTLSLHHIKVRIPDLSWRDLESIGVNRETFFRQLEGRLFFCSVAAKAGGKPLPLVPTPDGFDLSDAQDWNVVAIFKKKRLWKLKTPAPGVQ